MNLVERLLKIDKGEFNREKTATMESKQLSELFGNPTKITLKAMEPQEVLDITATGLDDDGNPIVTKTLKTNSKLTAAAIIDPSLKDTELLKHLGTSTPAEAALKLFKGEVNKIAVEVNRMAGFDVGGGEKTDNEIKN